MAKPAPQVILIGNRVPPPGAENTRTRTSHGASHGADCFFINICILIVIFQNSCNFAMMKAAMVLCLINADMKN